MPQRLRSIGAATLFLFAGIAAQPAAAATTVGQFPPPGTPDTCFAPAPPPSLGASFIQVDVGSGTSYEVPADGVITRWHSSVTADDPVVYLRTFQRTGGSTFVAIGESAPHVLVPGAPSTFDTRIPVLRGDLIGLRVKGVGNLGCTYSGLSPADVYVRVNQAKPAGEQETADIEVPGSRLNVAAEVEPDTDGDGYGDETQDNCPTNVGSQAACVVIEAAPKDKTQRRRARFAFFAHASNVTFECQLDKKGFKPCTSPRTFRNLRRRKHTFRVHTVSAGGERGPDAFDRWRVKRP